jgi:hypothetical protein
LRLLNRLRALTGALVKPVQAGWRHLPRLWALVTGRKIGGLSLYRQEFSGLDLGELLLAINQEPPGGKKGKAGKQLYRPAPGTVRLNGSFLWAGRTRKNGTV